MIEDMAKRLVSERYVDSSVAILAGSIVRGEGTDHSDLDLFILNDLISGPYRESFEYEKRPVEAFVHTFESYKEYFKMDCERARPSLPQMVFEGIIIKDNGMAKIIKQEAEVLLKKGPKAWTDGEARIARYFLTDLLDDFEGSTNPYEDIFIAGALAQKAHEFYLRMNGKWIGQSKWILRALKRFDPRFADEFAEAFRQFYDYRNKKMVIELVERILAPYGGRLFDGFSLGK